jgi:hypothetical protein
VVGRKPRRAQNSATDLVDRAGFEPRVALPLTLLLEIAVRLHGQTRTFKQPSRRKSSNPTRETKEDIQPLGRAEVFALPSRCCPRVLVLFPGRALLRRKFGDQTDHFPMCSGVPITQLIQRVLFSQPAEFDQRSHTLAAAQLQF